MPLPISQLQSTLLAKQLQYQAALDQAAQQAQQQAYSTMQEGGESSRRQSQTLAQPIYSMIGAEQDKAEGQAREQVRQEQMSREDQERAFGHMMAQEGLGVKRGQLSVQQGQLSETQAHNAFKEGEPGTAREWLTGEHALDRASRERAAKAMSVGRQADQSVRWYSESMDSIASQAKGLEDKYKGEITAATAAMRAALPMPEMQKPYVDRIADANRRLADLNAQKQRAYSQLRQKYIQQTGQEPFEFTELPSEAPAVDTGTGDDVSSAIDDALEGM